jgi:hypothetical protein
MKSFSVRSLFVLGAAFICSLALIPHAASATALSASTLTATSSIVVYTANPFATTTRAAIGDSVRFQLNFTPVLDPGATTTPIINIQGMGSTTMSHGGTGKYFYATTTSASWNDGPVQFYMAFGGSAGESTTTESQANLTTLPNVTIDSTAPTLASPIIWTAAGSNTEFASGDTMTATFSETMATTTIASTTLDTVLPPSNGHSWGTSPVAISWNSAGNILSVTLNAGSTITGADYVVPTSAVKDAVGNSYAVATHIAFLDNSAPATPTGLVGTVFHGSVSVTLASIGSSKILYTIDGSAPSCPSTGTAYTSAITISNSTTLSAIGCDEANNASSVVTAVYSPAAGGEEGGVTYTAPAAVNLGSAGNFAILSKSGISTTGSTSITGDIGVSPAAASYITGFALNLPAAGAYSTSAMVNGKVYAPDYAVPTPANLTTAVLDMQNAYTDAAGRTNPTVTELGAGNIGGRTLPTGLYKWSSGVTIPTDVTISGSASDVWIFQIAGDLTMSSGTHIILSGGARAANIFWQVAGQTTIGTTAVMNGNILDQTAIVLNTGATLNGRALAQTAVTLDAATVMTPGISSTVATPPVTPATPSPSTTSGVGTTPGTSASLSTPAAPATPAMPASGLSASQIQSILDVLASFDADTSTLASVRAALQGTTAGSVTSAAVHVFEADLTTGSLLGSEVKALQQYLNAHGYTIAASGTGSIGNETTTFGPLTKAALVKYQKAKGITPAVGYFGPLTRAAVNAGE